MTSIPLPTRASEMFCYGVYTASHQINRSYIPHLDRLGLTYPQYITLTLLWEADGQMVTQLAEKLQMGTGTMTPLLKRLEAKGFVKRVRGKRDSREVYVELSAQGQALRNEAPDITACMIQETSLSHSELLQLQRLLGKLTSGLSTNANKPE